MKCLWSGLNVTAFVRDPSRLPAELASHVTFCQGSSIIKEDVSKAMDGQDGVIVALGTRNDLSKIENFEFYVVIRPFFIYLFRVFDRHVR